MVNDDAAAELERRYRRLLLAYPRHYRRSRGLEMLTTLLDAAPPGRRRPHWRDRMDLILGGLRYRLGPGSAPNAIIAVAVALVFGALGAVTGGWIGWQGAGELPADEQARSMMDAALPGQPTHSIERFDVLFDYDVPPTGVEQWLVPLLGGDDYGPGWVDVFAPAVGDPASSLAEIHERMRMAGWQVGEVRLPSYGPNFYARNDRFIAYVEISPPWDGQEPVTKLSIYRAEPERVLPLAVGGALAGGAIGWVMAAGVARRMRYHPPVSRILAAVVTVVSLVLLFPVTALTLVGVFVSDVVAPEPGPPSAPWGLYMFILFRGPALLGLLGLLTVTAGSVLPTGERFVPHRPISG